MHMKPPRKYKVNGLKKDAATQEFELANKETISVKDYFEKVLRKDEKKPELK